MIYKIFEIFIPEYLIRYACNLAVLIKIISYIHKKQSVTRS